MMIAHIHHLVKKERVRVRLTAVTRSAREHLIPILMTALALGSYSLGFERRRARERDPGAYGYGDPLWPSYFNGAQYGGSVGAASSLWFD